MRLSFVEISGFRGYKNLVRINFGRDFTIIDGRNGVGKSTVFDAIEFALTGTIAKYSDAKADKETVDDYIWWRGAGDGPENRYVSVGFLDQGKEITVTRTSLKPDEAKNVQLAVQLLCSNDLEPAFALQQLCHSSIIRDEHIAALSLDLKETERFALLSSAIGATDSDQWVTAAQQIHKLSKDELQSAQVNADRAFEDRARAVLKVDAARSELLSEREVRNAVSRLQSLVQVITGPGSLLQKARQEIVRLSQRSESLRSLINLDDERMAAVSELGQLQSSIQKLITDHEALKNTIRQLSMEISEFPLGDEYSELASAFADLAAIGETIGCRDEACPLCRSEISSTQLSEGIERLRTEAQNLEKESVRIASLKSNLQFHKRKADEIESELSALRNREGYCNQVVSRFEEFASKVMPNQEYSRDELEWLILSENERMQSISALLPIIDSTGMNEKVKAADLELEEMNEVVASAERRLAIARKTEADSKALYDGVRRAAGETLSLRLERILPLITELYSRLRPHASFGKIDYKMRGELRRQLTFRVGDNVNPQFVFSSGQRRATGLAFLIAVHLSIAWSNWRTLMLDDPVQHIDDFRSVHLAELLGQLVREGRQIVCSVEDEALAELICRKMPLTEETSGVRLTLGINKEGEVDALNNRMVMRPSKRVLFSDQSNVAI